MSLLLLAATQDPAVEAAVRAFAAAADARDLPGLEAALHPDFRVVLTRAGTSGASVLPRATYLQLARDGKVGGTARTVTIHGTAARGDLGWASVTLASSAARFDSVMTLARIDGGWRVIEDAALFAAN